MNKLSFVIPCYGVKEHIIRNIDMWKEVSKLVDLIWIEDTEKCELKELVAGIGGRHFSKPNGNWGSVVNFARDNELAETEYVAIVDPDDVIQLEDIKTLINKIGTDDLYVTNYLVKDFVTNKVNKKSYRFDKYTFIHQIWFKTKIFNSIPKLPEGHFFMDNIVVDHILATANSAKNINVSPYVYFVNFEGQSTAGGFKGIENKLKSSKLIDQSISKKKSIPKLRWRQSVSRTESKNHSLILIRSAYDKESNSESRAKLVDLYKSNKKFLHPARTWLLWSRLYVFFKR